MVLKFIRQIFGDLRSPKDIFASIRPLLFVCFVSGIAPFKVVGAPGNRHLVVTIFGLAFTLFHLFSFYMCYVQAIKDQDIQTHFFNSKVSRFSENVQTITSFVAIGFAMIPCFLKRNKLRLLLNLMIQIDQKLFDLGAKINYKNVSRVVWFTLFFQWSIEFSFIGITSILLRSFQDSLNFLEWMYFFQPFAIIMTYKSKYYCIMRLIKSRFNYINITLKKLQMNTEEYRLCGISNDIVINRFGEITYNVGKLGVNSNRKKYDIIAELCRTHEQLCDVCNLAEEYFCHQMLTMISIEFFVSLFNLYFMIDMAFTKSPMQGGDSTDFLAYFTFYTTITTGSLFCLLRSAESVTKEVSSEDFQKQPNITVFVIVFNSRAKNVRSMFIN